MWQQLIQVALVLVQQLLGLAIVEVIPAEKVGRLVRVLVESKEGRSHLILLRAHLQLAQPRSWVVLVRQIKHLDQGVTWVVELVQKLEQKEFAQGLPLALAEH